MVDANTRSETVTIDRQALADLVDMVTVSRAALAACLAEARANPYLGNDAPLDWMDEIAAAVGDE